MDEGKGCIPQTHKLLAGMKVPFGRMVDIMAAGSEKSEDH